MFENWQSEMLQPMLQISLIAYLWFAGSLLSHSEESMEQKIDWLMEQLNGIEAEKIKKELEERFPKH